MLISRRLKEENIAEYLLYMWQVEDIIRASGFDIDQLETNYLSNFKANEQEKQELRQWYADIMDMMRSEDVKEKGHIQINKNTIFTLVELHQQLLKSPKYPYYSSAYFKALPLIVELRQKAGENAKGEIETCFEALYGIMIIRLQGKKVSEDTVKAMTSISQFIGMLSDYYKKDKKEPLEF